MRLLFDQNLSFRLCMALADRFPESSQVRLLGLERADDRTIWERAKSGDYTLVTQDSDFAELAGLVGPPPKVIWLRCGNQPTSTIANLLRAHEEAAMAFEADNDAACLEIY
jgi:predicted nuclease of predicted toxin-antitoxin system